MRARAFGFASGRRIEKCDGFVNQSAALEDVPSIPAKAEAVKAEAAKAGAAKADAAKAARTKAEGEKKKTRRGTAET